MADDMTLFLGTDNATWLKDVGPPLMVSLNRLPTSKTYEANSDWFCDSGGFTELQQHGRWRTSTEEHIERCRKAQRFGRMLFCSPQDWMCEPAVIKGGNIGLLKFAGTGLDVATHQRLTVENFLELRARSQDVPFIPVLQGWECGDYHRCADLYERDGVNLKDEPLVGVGSVCRRQSTKEAVGIMSSLAERGYRLHGFGFKQAGIKACWPYMASADSMAWSYTARARGNGCGGRRSCSHCKHEALDWRKRTIGFVGAPVQPSLWEEARRG